MRRSVTVGAPEGWPGALKRRVTRPQGFCRPAVGEGAASAKGSFVQGTYRKEAEMGKEKGPGDYEISILLLGLPKGISVVEISGHL